MVVNRSFPMPGQTGSIGALFAFGGSVFFSQLFDGVPQYYPGSIIQVEEIVRIYTSIVSPHLVDTDLNWWTPKQYIGSYQILSELGEPLHYEGDDGYLVDTIQNIRRYSTYTVTANPNTPVGLGESIKLDDCSFALTPDIVILPGETVPVSGALKLIDWGGDSALFRGYNTITAAPLSDTKFFRKIGGVGLFLQPGVEGISVDYTARIVNDIYTDYPAFPASQCYTSTPNCNQQFDAFIASSPGTFRTEAECDAYISPIPVDTVGICVLGTWVCPSDPTDIRTYYYKQYGN